VPDAGKQVEDSARLLSPIEGRPFPDYVLVAWDGRPINSGRYVHEQPVWENLAPSGTSSAQCVLIDLSIPQLDRENLDHAQMVALSTRRTHKGEVSDA
jgi:hypothetical protein